MVYKRVRKEWFYKDYDLNNLTKNKLLDDLDLAIGLARWNKNFGKSDLAQDMAIIKLNGGEVAFELACSSDVNGWAETDVVQKMEILSLRNGEVGTILAGKSGENGWGMTEAAKNLDVLRLRGGEVAKQLAWNSNKNGWGNTEPTQQIEILELFNGEVAKYLAEHSKYNGWGETLAAQDKRVLALKEGKVVEKLIKNMDENGWGDTLVTQDFDITKLIDKFTEDSKPRGLNDFYDFGDENDYECVFDFLVEKYDFCELKLRAYMEVKYDSQHDFFESVCEERKESEYEGEILGKLSEKKLEVFAKDVNEYCENIGLYSYMNDDDFACIVKDIIYDYKIKDESLFEGFIEKNYSCSEDFLREYVDIVYEEEFYLVGEVNGKNFDGLVQRFKEWSGIIDENCDAGINCVKEFCGYNNLTFKTDDDRHFRIYNNDEDSIKLRIADHSYSDGAGWGYGHSKPDYEIVYSKDDLEKANFLEKLNEEMDALSCFILGDLKIYDEKEIVNEDKKEKEIKINVGINM